MSFLVSIIIPCRNGGRFLDATLRSVLAQTWPAIEIIVVDDHSSDDSREVAARHAAPNVRSFATSSGGAAAARNRGLAEAKGDFIQYLDADDLLSPDKIAAQMVLLEQSLPGYVGVSATVHFHDGSDPSKGAEENGWPLVDSDDPLGWLIDLAGPDGGGGMVHPAAWLTPREVAERAGPWNERLSLDDDGEYFCRVVLASRGLRKSREGRSYYRKFPAASQNLSAQSSPAHQHSALLALDLRAEKILSLTDDHRAKRGLARYYLDRACSAYPDHPEVSDLALRRARALGIRSDPTLPSRRSNALAKVFGWKAVRRAGTAYHKLRARL